MLQGVADDVGQVGGEFFEEVGEVRRERGLADVHEETVWETPALHSVQGGHPSGPLVREGLATAANDLVPGPAGVRGPHLEAGGEDDAVDLVLDAGHNQSAFGDVVDTLPVGVDELYVGSVEGGQVLVVERRPLAEHPVVGLEFFGYSRSFDQVVHPGPDLVHLVEVGHLHDLGDVETPALSGFPEATDHLANQVGPAVVHEVLGLGQARDEAVEVLHASLLPAWLQPGGPLRVGGLVATHIHRRGRALEDVELLRRLSEEGNALDGTGASADDGNPFVT